MIACLKRHSSLCREAQVPEKVCIGTLLLIRNRLLSDNPINKCIYKKWNTAPSTLTNRRPRGHIAHLTNNSKLI